VETRASHILIGTFMLLMVAAVFAFVIWLSRSGGGSTKEYDVYFRESVAGLAVGGVVRFNGVPVGQVRRIALVPDDPGRVRVRVRIDEEVPILEGSVATMEAQGLTGVAFLQIEGGFQGAEPIKSKPGEPVPVIPARKSAISSLFVNAPQLLEQATVAVTRIGMLLNEENRTNISRTIANVETVTGGISRRTPEIERMITDLSATAAELKTTLASVDALAKSSQALVDGDAKAMIVEFRTLASRSQSLVSELDGMVKENRPGVAQFTESALPELSRLIIDLRQLSRSLNRVAEKFETSPADALLGGSKVPEYEGK
jgi:phospholipid/cholesterol/gamma-HCH transport system substrate-binding protein